MKTPNPTINKLVENITISAWVIDDDQNIVYMNKPMKDLFGDLSGLKTTVIYGCDSFEVAGRAEDEEEGIAEVLIADVPFRRISATADLDEEGKYTVELFEDISEHKIIHNNMTRTLSRIRAETRTAKTIQHSILPIDDTYWGTIAFSSKYVPAEDLSGDFYDILKLSEDEYLIYIADVMGHGIQTALLTVYMRERVRVNIEAALQGTDILLSKLVHDYNSIDIDGVMYITMVLCKYSKSRRELSISNAGHGCSPLIIRNNGRTEIIPIRGMPICTLAEDIDYDEETVRINPGDRLILYTDGVVEEIDSTTGRSLGAEGIRELAEKHHAYDGAWLSSTIIDKSDRFALIRAKDDRSVVVADILS